MFEVFQLRNYIQNPGFALNQGWVAKSPVDRGSAGLFLYYGLNFSLSDKSINDRKDMQSVVFVKPGHFQDAFTGSLVHIHINFACQDGIGKYLSAKSCNPLNLWSDLLNLPDSITDQTDFIWLDYTFGGQKIRKEFTGGEERFYLGVNKHHTSPTFLIPGKIQAE
ncbi:MAG: hypothetical protein IPH04_16895 [Saprospirales bacterium]|nr:hypothetical protein [Saprospirales bacterium]